MNILSAWKLKYALKLSWYDFDTLRGLDAELALTHKWKKWSIVNFKWVCSDCGWTMCRYSGRWSMVNAKTPPEPIRGWYVSPQYEILSCSACKMKNALM